MPILNYTTSIDPTRTTGEIQKMLQKHDIVHFSIRYEDKNPVGVTFAIQFNGQMLNFYLDCNIKGVHNCLINDPKVPFKNRTKEQALKTSWRILKDWIVAQLALVEAELTTLPKVFLPYVVILS